MTTLMLLAPSQAANVREIALAAASGTVTQQLVDAGLGDLVAFPYRARLRLGEPPVRDIAHMALGDLQRSNAVGLVVYRRREPACRECGQPVAPGHVVVFGLKPSSYNVFGRQAFLHYPACPDA